MSFFMPPSADHVYVIAIEIVSGLTALCGLALLVFKVIRSYWTLSDEASERRRQGRLDSSSEP